MSDKRLSGPLLGGPFNTIVADPPWSQPNPNSARSGWRGKGAPSRLPYATLTLGEIAALPVERLAAKNAHLYLWTTNHFLERSFDVARAWGFKPSTVLVWAKTPRGKGPGGAFAITTEFIIFARRGSLPALAKQDSTWWNWTRPHNNHSAKPEGFLDLVEQVSPGPYLELFARRNRMGWSAWGDQVLSDVEMPA